MAYMTHAINDSPVITGEAGASIAAPAMKVMALNSSGKFVLPAAGSIPIGVALATKVDAAIGDRMDVQIRGICFALAGAAITRGSVLMANTSGQVVTATAGNHVIGIALGSAQSGKPVEMLIMHTLLPAAS